MKKDELFRQDKIIRKSILLVFISIFIVLISIGLIQDNTLSYLEKQYYKTNTDSYSGVITDLLEQEDNGRTRTILINEQWRKEVPFFIYDKLQIGDSLYKNKNSDFEYFIINSKTEILKRDINKEYREKYFKKLKSIK